MYMGIWTPSKKIKDLFPYAMPSSPPALERSPQTPGIPRDPPGPGSLASDLTLGHWDAWNVPPHRSRFALASYDCLICFDSDSLRNSMIYVYTVHISILIVHIYIYNSAICSTCPSLAASVCHHRMLMLCRRLKGKLALSFIVEFDQFKNKHCKFLKTEHLWQSHWCWATKKYWQKTADLICSVDQNGCIECIVSICFTFSTAPVCYCNIARRLIQCNISFYDLWFDAVCTAFWATAQPPMDSAWSWTS